MAFLRRQSQPRPSPSPAEFDPFLGDADIRRHHDELVAGRWEASAQFVDARPDRWLVMGLWAADHSRIAAPTVASWSADTRSSTALSLLGRVQTRDAWAIRGRAYAEHVDADAWPRFFAGLEEAEATLWSAAQADPDSPEPWVGLLTTARGLQFPKDELNRRFQQCQDRLPYHPSACNTMLQGLCAKWSGSHEAMFSFARYVAQHAHDGSPAIGVLPMAHIEYAIERGRHGTLKVSEHLASPEVASEVADLCERYLAATPASPSAAYLEPLNLFVMTVVPSDHRRASLVTECVRRIGERPTAMPWTLFADPIPVRYAKIRGERLRMAGGGR